MIFDSMMPSMYVHLHYSCCLIDSSIPNTLSGRPGGYPDDDLIQKKNNKIKESYQGIP